MVIDLPFEGSRKNRRRERVPHMGSRREETIIEPILNLEPKTRMQYGWMPCKRGCIQQTSTLPDSELW